MLRVVPDRPPRAVAYIRVSKEGGRGPDLMSPDIQLTAIRDHCARNGYELVTVLEPDIDRTGLLWKSRRIEDAVQMIEAGEVDVIVAWKVSRVSRNRKDWAVAADRVESVGGRLESAVEPIDTQTAAGRLSRGVLVEIAAFESEVIGETWQAVHRQRREHGLPHYGPQRLGYSYSKAGYVLDDQADIVRDLYARYSSGEGLGTLTAWLRAEGVTGARGKPWSRFGVSYYLKSGFAAGFLYVHDPACRCGKKGGACGNRIHIPGAQQAILTPTEWAAYQRAKAGRATAPIRSRIPVSKLAGVVICAGCGRPMQLQASGGKPRHAFVCRSNRLTLDGCPNPGWVRRDECEAAVLAWLPTVQELVDAEVEERAAAPVAQQRKDRLGRRVIDADRALGKLAADLARGLIPETAYLLARDELTGELEVARAELRRIEGPDLSGVPETAAGLLKAWDAAEPHEIAALGKVLLRVQIRRGHEPLVVGAWTVQGPS